MAITPMTPLVARNAAGFAASMENMLNEMVVFGPEANLLQIDVNAKQLLAAANANAAQADRIIAAAAAASVTAANPATNAAAAAASAQAAAVSAAIAQAVSPDSPVRFNSRVITGDLTIGSAYNAASAGPITIADGVTVALQDNATWSIN